MSEGTEARVGGGETSEAKSADLSVQAKAELRSKRLRHEFQERIVRWVCEVLYLVLSAFGMERVGRIAFQAPLSGPQAAVIGMVVVGWVAVGWLVYRRNHESAALGF